MRIYCIFIYICIYDRRGPPPSMPLTTTGFPRPPRSGPIFSNRVIFAFEEWSTFRHLLINAKLIEKLFWSSLVRQTGWKRLELVKNCGLPLSHCALEIVILDHFSKDGGIAGGEQNLKKNPSLRCNSEILAKYKLCNLYMLIMLILYVQMLYEKSVSSFSVGYLF